MEHDFDADYIVVGSGFGGSASALRLTQKGYRVLMLERGRQLQADDFPKTNWNLKRWLWAPRLGFRGLFVMRFFRHVTVLAGAGIGGGSLVYANTLPIPKSGFFKSEAWAKLADWETELAPHYREAQRMMGAVATPFLTTPDQILKKVAENRGQPGAFESTQTAVYYGKAGVTVPDPYFDGEGPDRTGCIRCGACMTGCRHNSKNTLDKNYLYLARKHGLRLQPDTEVVNIRPVEGGGYEVEAKHGARWFGRERQIFRARQVILAGGVLGTLELLLKLKRDGLPGLSDRLGCGVRTNSESLIGVCATDMNDDLSKGVSIGSILQTDEKSHLEMVRYGAGSGFFRLGMFPHVGGNSPGVVKLAKGLALILRHPLKALKAYTTRDWAKKTMILLYMRNTEGTLRMQSKRSLTNPLTHKMASTLEGGEKPIASIAEATALAHEVAKISGGFASSLVNEVATNIPTTAHILGGCCMGSDASNGVIDHRHRVFGYEGLFVVDGSAISANPGVNPSLTILALAERAMSFIPPKSAVSSR